MNLANDDHAKNTAGRLPNRLIEGSIVFLLFFTPLAIGTVHPWARAVLCGACLLIFCVTVWQKRESKNITVTPLGVALVFLAVWTGLQATPLPAWVIATLSPKGLALQQLAASDAGAVRPWVPISLDRFATLAELANVLGYTLLFLTVVNCCKSDDRREGRLLAAMAGAGALVAGIGFVQTLVGTPRILGVYGAPSSFFFATFVNPNHLAAFLGMASTVALGMALSSRDRGKRVVFVALSVFTGISVFLTLSRGGIIAYVAGQLFLGCLLLMRRAKSGAKAALVLLLATLVLGTSGWLAYTQIATKFDRTSMAAEGRVQVWKDDLALIRDFPISGIGPGAYAQLHFRYKSSPEQITYLYAENSYLQAVVDWGVGGLLFVLCLAATFVLAVRRQPMRGRTAGILAALFVVGLHNFVDFNIETGAVAVSCVVLMAFAASRAFAANGASRWLPQVHLPVRILRVAMPVVLAILTVSFVLSQMRSLESDTRRLVLAQKEPGPGFLAVAEEATLRHPADYFLALTTGLGLIDEARRDLPTALDWIGRAGYLNPTDPAVHLMTARLLVSMGAIDEAIVAYRLAGELMSRDAVLTEAVQNLRGPYSLRSLVPPDPQNQVYLARFLLRKGMKTEAHDIAGGLLDKGSTVTSDPQILHLASDLDEQAGDDAQAAQNAERALAADSHQTWAYLLLARVAGRTREGDPLLILERGMQQDPSPELALQAAGLALSRHDLARARALARRLMELGLSARAYFLSGQIDEVGGNYPLALQQYRSAQSAEPARVEYAVAVARTLERLGIKSEAIETYRAILRQYPSLDWIHTKLLALEGERTSYHVQN